MRFRQRVEPFPNPSFEFLGHDLLGNDDLIGSGLTSDHAGAGIMTAGDDANRLVETAGGADGIEGDGFIGDTDY